MWPEIFVQFLTVFSGAFLAFWLENLRERQQLKSWVRKYLKGAYDSLREQLPNEEKDVATFEEELGVYPKFFDGEDASITNEDWDKLRSVNYIFTKDSVSLLEGEALRVLDGQLAKLLNQTEQLSFAVIKINELYTNMHGKYIEPIYTKKHLPLEENEKKQAKSFHTLALQLLEYRKKSLEVSKNLLAKLEKHNHHK